MHYTPQGRLAECDSCQVRRRTPMSAYSAKARMLRKLGTKLSSVMMPPKMIAQSAGEHSKHEAAFCKDDGA